MTLELSCDACGAWYGPLAPLHVDDARRLATDNGWRCDADWDLCPTHAALTAEEVRLLCPF